MTQPLGLVTFGYMSAQDSDSGCGRQPRCTEPFVRAGRRGGVAVGTSGRQQDGRVGFGSGITHCGTTGLISPEQVIGWPPNGISQKCSISLSRK